MFLTYERLTGNCHLVVCFCLCVCVGGGGGLSLGVTPNVGEGAGLRGARTRAKEGGCRPYPSEY